MRTSIAVVGLVVAQVAASPAYADCEDPYQCLCSQEGAAVVEGEVTALNVCNETSIRAGADVRILAVHMRPGASSSGVAAVGETVTEVSVPSDTPIGRTVFVEYLPNLTPPYVLTTVLDGAEQFVCHNVTLSRADALAVRLGDCRNDLTARGFEPPECSDIFCGCRTTKTGDATPWLVALALFGFVRSRAFVRDSLAKRRCHE